MSDVNTVLSGQGNYGFEDTVARKRAEKAVELVNENRTVIDETVEQINGDFKILESAFITKKLSGSILRIDDSANGLFSSFKMVIPPDQNGEGDPSPENIRSFVQHNLNPNGLGIYVYICNGNMFKFTYDSATSSGITKTVNSDGSVSFEGTSESSSTIVHNLGLFYLPAGTYQFYGMPELEDGVSFRYRMNANSIGGSLIRYFETDGTIFELTQRTRVGIRAYLTAPQGTEVDFDIYPIIKLVDDPNKEFTTNPSVYTSWFTTPASTKFVTGMFEISNDPTVGYYREFKRYTNYNGELLPGRWVSDRDVYVPGALPTIGADVFDLETTESTAYRLTSNTDYGASIIYNDTYLYGLTDNHVITAEYITNRSVNYESLNELRYRPHLFDAIAMKCLKTIPLYEDSYTYYANGFAVTDKYLVLALIPVKTSPIAEKINVFMAFDKNTLELADIEHNPNVVNVVEDLGLVGSHANNMTFVPPDNEIYVRTAKSRKSIVLNADTLDVKRVETMPHNGGCAYDSVTNQWAFLATTNGVTALTITNGSRDTILKKVSINSQGYTQGITFYNGIIFVPTSTDNLNKGNSIVAVNTDGVVLADWWFDGGDEFEDVDIMDDSRLLLLTTSYASGYRIYSAAYKPFNKKSTDIKSYDIYQTSTIDDLISKEKPTFNESNIYETFDLSTLYWTAEKQLNSNGAEGNNAKASVCMYLYSPKGSRFSVDDGYMFNIATFSDPVASAKTEYRGFSSAKYTVTTDCYVKISVVNSDNTTPVTAEIAKSVLGAFVYSETKAEKYKNEVQSVSNLDIPLENGTLGTTGAPEDAINRVRSSKGVYIKVNTVLKNLNSVSINWRSYKDEECTQFYSSGGNFTTGDITIGKSNYYKFVIQKNNYANGSLSQYLSIDNNNIQQDHETRISNLEFATQPLRGMPIIFAPSSPYHYTGSSITESIINGSGNLLTPLYALYDDLEAVYPNHITKEVLGYDQSGLHEIRAYTIQQHKAPISKPVVLWISGVHGSETYTHTATYMFVKELLENNQNDDVLGFIWRNCVFKVIPIANPWGLANGASRYNSRGVNLNRNFNADWEFSDEQYNASGEAPESEAETQVIVNFVNANKNAIFAVNKHDSGTLASENGRIAYSVDDFRIDLTIMRALYSQLQVSMLKNYPWLVTNRPASEYTLMFSSLSTASDHGTMDKWFSTIGVHGCLLEVSRPASDDYTANKKQDFIKMNLETSVNMISAMIEKNQLMASNDALWYEYAVIE